MVLLTTSLSLWPAAKTLQATGQSLRVGHATTSLARMRE
jgi:hypothetical protein